MNICKDCENLVDENSIIVVEVDGKRIRSSPCSDCGLLHSNIDKKSILKTNPLQKAYWKTRKIVWERIWN
ncbi:MAG: hypothetical protein KAS02_00105 [Candidatus Pacebacteria bacterium]|nr:hypothetical protein [Candidatus Paceibacterota bacterium]